MTTMMQTYTNESTASSLIAARERTGGSHGNRPETTSDRIEYFMASTPFGSHMPLDTQMHWNWSNPLNVIPAFMLLLFLLTAIGLIVQ